MSGNGVRWILDPDEAAVLSVKVRRIAFPGSHAVSLAPLPGTDDRLAWLASDLLEALGKRMSSYGTPRGAVELWSLARTWLSVERIALVVIVGVDFVGAKLLRMLGELDTEVLLVYEGDVLPDGHREALAGIGAGRVDLEEAKQQIVGHVGPRRRRLPLPPADEAPVFPAVPRDAFPYFWPRCKEVLSREDFEVVAEVYTRADRQTETFLARSNVDHFDVAEFLQALVAESPSVDRELTALRGAEHGFFRDGWLLRVDPDALAARGAPLPAPITVRHLECLRWYANARVAAIAALAFSGLTPEGITTLDVDQLLYSDAGHGMRVLGDHRRDLGALAPFVKAHVLHAGLSRDQCVPLFQTAHGSRMKAASARTALRRVVQETGFRYLDHWTPPADQRATHWMRASGLTLQPL